MKFLSRVRKFLSVLLCILVVLQTTMCFQSAGKVDSIENVVFQIQKVTRQSRRLQ